MSILFISVVSLLYLGAAIDLLIHDNPALSIAFACYAVANMALLATIK